MKNINEEKYLNDLLNGKRLPIQVSTDRAWEIQRQRIEDAVPVIPMRNRMTTLSAYAAGFAAIFIAVFVFFNNTETIYKTGMAQHASYTLPDGSKVWLNAESEVRFDEEGWEEKRSMELKGEAFFQVKKGSAFIVATKTANVQVLGTSFNVFARGQELSVSCKTGKVKVYNNKEEHLLLPSDKIDVIENQWNSSKIEKSDVGLWYKGKFTFEEADLDAVLQELKRQFDIEIDYSPKLKRDLRYTGTFTTENLNEALELVCAPLGLHYQIGKNGNSVIIN